jgi:hypothetical protein
VPASAQQQPGWLRGLIAAGVLLVVLAGVLLARGAYGRAGQAAQASATAAPGQLGVQPTAIPAVAADVTAMPTTFAQPPTALPEATALPVPDASQPVPTVAPPAAPQVSQAGASFTVRLDDVDWQGGFRRPGGQTYGGRTATWIYGRSTEYSTMSASFVVNGTPAGTATLTVEGMDSEGRTKTPIQLLINGTEIYNGPNPLPDDDQPLETGTWASQSWTFDASLLRPGQNQVSFSNLAEGAFSRPPFFMLDYAELTYNTE